MASNHHEATARAKKVCEIFLTCRARHIGAEQVATDPYVRSMLVNVARLRLPTMGEPSDLTWSLVVQTLAQAEQFEAATGTCDLIGA